MNDIIANPVNSAAAMASGGGARSHMLSRKGRKETKRRKRMIGDMRGERTERHAGRTERALRWKSFQRLIKDGRRERPAARLGFSSVTLALTFKYYPFIFSVPFLWRPSEGCEGVRGGHEGVRGGLIVPLAQSHCVDSSDCRV